MKAQTSPARSRLKRQYRAALRDLRKAVSDFTPGADDRFRAMKRRTDDLFAQLYFEDRSS